MLGTYRWSVFPLAALALYGLAAPLAAQSPAGSAAAPGPDACALATNAEVKEVSGADPRFTRFWQEPEPLGSSRCEYSGGSLEVYRGRTAPADFEGTLKNFKVDKEPRVPVQGIGDRAFFMIPKPGDEYQRIGLLAVYAGPRVVVLTLEANKDEPLDATRPRLERFAKLVLPRIR
jgi:hypothetical protein